MLCNFSSVSPIAMAFTSVNIPVIRAADLVEESSKAIALGSTLQLTVKGTPSAQMFRAHDFQIRMFRLPPNNFMPDHWDFIEQCYIYLSTVFRISGAHEDVINIGQFMDDRWLNPSFNGKMGNGRYLLVFEVLSDDGPIFRLHKDRMVDYFRNGLYIEITPSRMYTAADVTKLATLVANSSDGRYEEIHSNSPKRKCYRFRPVNVANEDANTELATLDICESTFTPVADNKAAIKIIE